MQNKSLVVLDGPLCDNLYKPMNKKAPRVAYPTEVRVPLHRGAARRGMYRCHDVIFYVLQVFARLIRGAYVVRLPSFVRAAVFRRSHRVLRANTCCDMSIAFCRAWLRLVSTGMHRVRKA